MNSLNQKLRNLLGALAGSAQPPEGADLIEILRELDRIRDEHAGELHPQMLHYLQRRSYEKALSFLSNPEMPHQP
ncbi:hypothetical protein QPK87_27420 [Kamptonema cortianum]|nr:hypothetical protein [Oscillatoria laete-virens]MDK3160260.1 hypothetical protein [Kamptonema cortianum]MDL5048388.1 hypothetical protein [Oscillatoria amoena NRMC-F 0135]MDL5054247.1 hypothetical protein [Oscillatoria laete-virens NRMC-F 0139]